jgi:hypothetical protein
MNEAYARRADASKIACATMGWHSRVAVIKTPDTRAFRVEIWGQTRV